ncbi:hypothetical protein DL769_008422 [Monosporascus sp. CRB-8-3]|nr:hypothetical protein DL769_008422 [Monosporascus sp. CRB-8-3]
MPRPSARDVVIVHAAKVQDRNGISLLTNRNTVIHIYSAVQIPKPPRSAGQALQPPCSPHRWMPSEEEHVYVSWLYHATDKGCIPDQDEFRVQAEQSLNIKQKFSTLNNVQDGRFYDVIVQVVKDPFDQLDKMNFWITDYTENERFFLYSWDGANKADGVNYDQNMYTTLHNGSSRNWPGPFGKRSMQISCWEPHATFVRDNVKAGNWVRLRNLHVRFGHNSANLEGFLHADRDFSGKIQVEILDTTDPENLDERLKEAIRRKRTYEKNKKQQQKKYTAHEQDGGAGAKRKADDDNAEPAKMNSKTRRKLNRSALEQKFKEQEKKKEEVLGLNKYIRCESEDQAITPISTIIEPVPWTTKVDGNEVTLTLPFICAKYRANVRVVDFRPRKLEDFARWRKMTDYDALSEYSGSGSEDSDGETAAGNLESYRDKKTWEWRFALQLEGVDSKGRAEPDRLWAVVDNTEAQQLANLDACDLRADPDTLLALREQLFKLWGNLEELRAAEQQQQQQVQKRVAAGQPPPDSSPPAPVTVVAREPSLGAGENDRGNLNSNGNGNDNVNANNKDADRNGVGGGGKAVSNKPFTCCIRQYGVRVKERDPARANAGDGTRWERVFGLFGTRICS